MVLCDSAEVQKRSKQLFPSVTYAHMQDWFYPSPFQYMLLVELYALHLM